MAEATKPAEAPKPVAKAEPVIDSDRQWSEDEDGNLVFHGEFPDQSVVDHARKVISDELKDSDAYESDGLADNVTGDASEKASDYYNSPDPAKRAFPPGPDDTSKL